MEKSMMVTMEEAGQRLDVVLAKGLGLSRSRAKAALERGDCLINGAECRDGSRKLRGGEELVCRVHQESALEAQPCDDNALTVLHQGAGFVVLNKSPGVVIHPGVGDEQETLVHRMLADFPQLATMGGKRPGVVHRLDKDTSGLLVLALDEESRLKLAEDFAGRRVHKRYLAITRGVLPPEGEVNAPIGRHPSLKTRQAVRPDGKEARTAWKRLYADPNGKFSVVEVLLHTGRTHQIRVHMAHLGHSLWGDKVYGKPGPFARQMLHAWRLSFDDPANNKRLNFCMSPPADFLDCALILSRNCRKVILTGAAGSGKSTVLRLLAKAGLPTWSADECVAKLYETGGDGWHFLQGRFGGRFTGEGGVDKKALAEAMEHDVHLRREVEGMIHPMVFSAMRMFFDTHADKAFAVAEVPLWWEGGGKPDEALAVCVYTGRQGRWKRLAENRGWSEQRCAWVDSLQWPEEKKAEASRITLNNSADAAHLEKEATALLDKLELLRKEERSRLAAHLAGLWQCKEGKE